MADEGGPVLDQVNLVVRDMESAVAFYRRLGLTIPDQPPGWNDHHRPVTLPRSSGGLDFDLDSATFAGEWDEGWPTSPGTGVVLGLRVASRETVDAIYADVTGAGYRGQQPPYDAFWGARYAVLEDPDANAIGIMSPTDPARRRMPDPPGQ